MSPETPFFASGALLFLAGVARGKAVTQNVMVAMFAVLGLAVVASATANTPVAPLVRAIGLLFLLTSGSAAILALSDESKKRKVKK